MDLRWVLCLCTASATMLKPEARGWQGELVIPWRSAGLVLVGLVATAILRVVLSRPRRGSVVWVLAVLAIACSCPAFVASPYRLSLQSAHTEKWTDVAEQFKTASVAGAVAFLMNCGIQGVDADPSTLQDIYPQGPPAAIEQRVSYERAPLTYGGVQQKLYMEDLSDAQLRAQAQPTALVEATDSEELEALEGRIAAERLRLREAEQHLRHLEDDLQAAKVHRAQQAATETQSGVGFRDVLLMGFGAIMGAAGYALACLHSPKPLELGTSGALGLAFTASVYTSAPALSTAPVHLNATHALPLLTMRSARLESEDLLPNLKMEKVNSSKVSPRIHANDYVESFK